MMVSPARRSTRLLAVAVVVGMAALAAGCGASVGVTVHVEDHQEELFRQQWRDHWARVRADAVPYRPTAISPGVCNVGGSRQLCHDTDVVVAADVTDLLPMLVGPGVPARFRSASAELQAALRMDVRALGLRAYAIEHTDDHAWQQSRTVMASAITRIQAAWAKFPPADPPDPPPFI
jgi:hypothetical protein